MIYTKTFIIPKHKNIEDYILNAINIDMEEPDHAVLRYAITKVNDHTIEVDASILEDGYRLPYHHKISITPNNKFNVVMVIPTGVRAEIGGYIADGTPVTNVLASIVDNVITHPNVLNGSFLNYGANNVLYVEGHHLDNFLQNKIGLCEIYQNKIGVVVDKGAVGVDFNSLKDVINSIEALRVIAGIDVVGYKITDEPIGGHAVKMPSESFCGEVKNPDTLLRAAKELIKAGATAIAIATHIDIDSMEEDLDKYFAGELANPFGGTEALLSHTVSHLLKIPCAHAPILSKLEKDYYESVGVVDPRASSEVVSPGYLGCILKGLNRSPQISEKGFGITLDSVKAIIVPYGCCGGIPALAAQKFNIPLIAVKENKTVFCVTPEKMNINAIIVNNYVEAIGIVAALKAGISMDMLRRPIKPVQSI
jgi:hypothetical protein